MTQVPQQSSAIDIPARADALEATMKAFSWTSTPSLQPPRRDPGLIRCRLHHRANDETIRRHPRCIPALQRRAAHRALEAVHFARRSHGFRATVHGAAFAVPVLVGHGRRIYADSLVFTIGPKLKPNASASKSQSRASPWRRWSVATCSGSTSNDKRAAQPRGTFASDRNREPSFILARRNTGTFAFRSCSWA